MQPRQTLAPTDDLELGSVYTAVSEAPPPYNDHHHQSARGMTPLTFDWRRPATALVMTAGVAVLAGVFLRHPRAGNFICKHVLRATRTRSGWCPPSHGVDVFLGGNGHLASDVL